MKPFLTFILLIIPVFSFGQKEIKVSENLTLTKLSKSVYIQTSANSNGLVYVVGKEAVIISTPPTDTATIELLDWIKKELKATVKACIVDHWHGDAMEGVDVLYKEGIESYALNKTIQIAYKMKLFAPAKGFDDSLTISVGNKKISMRYFGPNHTADGIMVWIPNEKILFGGCGVKNKGGWVGNIADACMPYWSETVERVKVAYPNTKIVVPGHGKHGDTSLLTYTIGMFKQFEKFRHRWGGGRFINITDFPTNGWVEILKGKDTLIDGKNYLLGAILAVDNDTQTFHIFSPLLAYDSANKTIKADKGYIDLIQNRSLIRTMINFKNLSIIRTENELSVIIEEFAK